MTSSPIIAWAKGIRHLKENEEITPRHSVVFSCFYSVAPYSVSEVLALLEASRLYPFYDKTGRAGHNEALHERPR